MAEQQAQETRYFLGSPCPKDPTKRHAIPVRISSTVPLTTIEPTTTDADVEWHWCEGFPS
ncbi:MAG: hypothetical protein ACXVXP_00190 [Mycobacteriaceae bacterium]